MPAILAWLVLGLVLSTLPVRLAALAAMVAYCAYYGVQEAATLPGLRPPGIRWQVPQSVVRGASKRRRILTWGAILGPGLATRNPYAGFGALLLAIAAIGNLTGALVAVAIGAAHAAGRALALLRDAAKADATDYFSSTLKSLYWRQADGLALLGIGGATAIALLNSLI